MKNKLIRISTKVAVCCLCGAVLTPIFVGYACQNASCPDYLLEKHEHMPESQSYVNNFSIPTITLSGTAASGVSGAYEPINFIKWYNGGDKNG